MDGDIRQKTEFSGHRFASANEARSTSTSLSETDVKWHKNEPTISPRYCDRAQSKKSKSQTVRQLEIEPPRAVIYAPIRRAPFKDRWKPDNGVGVTAPAFWIAAGHPNGHRAHYATTPLFSKSTIRTIIERLGSKGISTNPHRR
jgi:hypothetical protein